MCEACDVILTDLAGAGRGHQTRALEHRRDADDRPHARRARRADDLRLEAGAVVRRDGPRTSPASSARARGRGVGKISGAVGTFAHLDPSIEADVCRRLRPAAGADFVAGHSARSARGAARPRSPSPPRRSRSSRSRFAACRRPRSAKSRSRSARGRRARRRCRTSATPSAASRSSGWRAWSAPTPWPRSRTSRCGTSATSRIRRSSASSCPTASSPSTTCCAASRASSPGMVVYPDRMRENLERSRGVMFSGQVLLELARRGVSREQAYEWVQRNAMRSFDEQRDFKALLLADADVTRRAAPGRKSRRRSTSTSSCGTSTRSSIACFEEEQVTMRARVYVTLEAVGVRSAGPRRRRRALVAGLRGREGRAAGKVLRGRARRRRSGRGQGARHGDGRQAAGQSRDRELSRGGARR